MVINIEDAIINKNTFKYYQENMSELIVLNQRYQLEERLGSGGMAVVYRARDLTLERTVAIKILRKDYSKDPEFRKRFHHEAKAAANLSHPNIVTVHDFGLFGGQLFIVMEHVPGTDLKTILKQRRRLEIGEAVDLITQACAGIGYAHRADLVHCDVKPQNMLVTPDIRLKVVDFGIARALSTISPDERADVVWGSPQYFSPEQAAGNAPSPASDVYSLGVILYEMLTGRLPFVAKTAEELASQHRDTLPPSPRKYNPSIPKALEQIILKTLAKEPSARYRTADQLGRVITNYDLQPIRAMPDTREIIQKSGYSSNKKVPGTHSTSSINTLGTPLIIGHGSPTTVVVSPSRKVKSLDLATWLLVFLALIAVGGLIPFWMWVIMVITPPF